MAASRPPRNPPPTSSLHPQPGPAAHPLPDIPLRPAPRPSRPPEAPAEPVRPAVDLMIDGVAVSVPAVSPILEACRHDGNETPTRCYVESLAPVSVCGVCCVEVSGSGVLVPACSRKVEAGMDGRTDSE